jgi:hypothetical protein
MSTAVSLKRSRRGEAARESMRRARRAQAAIIDDCEQRATHLPSATTTATDRANNAFRMINAPATSSKRTRSQIEEDEEQQIPVGKKVKSIPAETYNDLHYRYIEQKKLLEKTESTVLDLKHQLAQVSSKLASHDRIFAGIYEVHRMFSEIDEPTEDEARLKPAHIFHFNNKEYLMDYDEYQTYKNRKQKNVVLARLLALFDIPAHKHCLPGDRRSGRDKFSQDTLKMIVDQAIKHFTVFRGATFDSVKANIGKVCSNATTSMTVRSVGNDSGKSPSTSGTTIQDIPSG